jgi:hypothetical protein
MDVDGKVSLLQVTSDLIQTFPFRIMIIEDWSELSWITLKTKASGRSHIRGDHCDLQGL